jgi:hypothetical protein
MIELARLVKSRRCVVVIALAIAGSMARAERADAQFPPIIVLPGDLPVLVPNPYPPSVATPAAGPLFPAGAWGQTLAPNLRFIILTNFQGDAVLDRETGLVWARQPLQRSGERSMFFEFADQGCFALTVGNRRGWRLPTSAELLTLIDVDRPFDPAVARLPQGHPFLLQDSYYLWTRDDFVQNGDEDLLAKKYHVAVDIRFGSVLGNEPNETLCVRGRQ